MLTNAIGRVDHRCHFPRLEPQKTSAVEASESWGALNSTPSVECLVFVVVWGLYKKGRTLLKYMIFYKWLASGFLKTQKTCQVSPSSLFPWKILLSCFCGCLFWVENQWYSKTTKGAAEVSSFCMDGASELNNEKTIQESLLVNTFTHGWLDFMWLKFDWWTYSNQSVSSYININTNIYTYIYGLRKCSIVHSLSRFNDFLAWYCLEVLYFGSKHQTPNSTMNHKG